MRAFITRLGGLVTQGMQRGELYPDLPVETCAFALWSDYLSVLILGLHGEAMALEGQLTTLGALSDLRLHGMVAAARTDR